jgi:hypothetical protein
MPQFDTFSFFSQLFWVFSGFLCLYLTICFYILPALASILKIRKRKLTQISTGSVDELLTKTEPLVAVKYLIDSFNTKLNNLTQITTTTKNTIVTNSKSAKHLMSVSFNFESNREYNLSVLNKAHTTTFLYV